MMVGICSESGVCFAKVHWSLEGGEEYGAKQERNVEQSRKVVSLPHSGDPICVLISNPPF